MYNIRMLMIKDKKREWFAPGGLICIVCWLKADSKHFEKKTGRTGRMTRRHVYLRKKILLSIN